MYLSADPLVKGHYTGRFTPAGSGEYTLRYAPPGQSEPVEARLRVTPSAGRGQRCLPRGDVYVGSTWYDPAPP